MLRGAEFFLDGMVNFTPTPREDRRKVDGTYRTAFGPCYSHNGEIYEDSDHNMRLALTRLFATREPERPGYHRHLYNLQTIFHHDHRDFFDELRALYAPFFDGYEGMLMAAQEHHGDPHPKRELRVQAWRELQEGGVSARLWLKRVLYKFKKDEVAKAGKKPGRGIGDLGVAASLQGFVITSLLKKAQAELPYHTAGGVIEFIKSPNPWKLDALFQELISPSGRFHFVYFSDDSCFSVRIRGRVHVFNLDIKKCDASHQRTTFESLISVFPSELQDDVRRLVEQCELPIEVQSSSTRERIILKPRQPRLYSGSTLTTVINNLANQTIGLALSLVDWDSVSEDAIEDVILKAAESAGYMISVEACDQIEDIQFLKNSPVIDTEGKVRPLLNIGVLLRSSGQCKGDLAGRGDLRVRAEAFQSALLQGAYPRVSAPFIDRMKETAGKPILSTKVARAMERQLGNLQYKVEKDETYPHFTVTDEALFKRYRLTDLEIGELFESAAYGYEYHHCLTGADKVLERDYGLRSKARL